MPHVHQQIYVHLKQKKRNFGGNFFYRNRNVFTRMLVECSFSIIIYLFETLWGKFSCLINGRLRLQNTEKITIILAVASNFHLISHWNAIGFTFCLTNQVALDTKRVVFADVWFVHSAHSACHRVEHHTLSSRICWFSITLLFPSQPFHSLMLAHIHYSKAKEKKTKRIATTTTKMRVIYPTVVIVNMVFPLKHIELFGE